MTQRAAGFYWSDSDASADSGSTVRRAGVRREPRPWRGQPVRGEPRGSDTTFYRAFDAVPGGVAFHAVPNAGGGTTAPRVREGNLSAIRHIVLPDGGSDVAPWVRGAGGPATTVRRRGRGSGFVLDGQRA